jgi:uncharacterized protein
VRSSAATGANRIVVGFVRSLRGAGLAVPISSAILFTEALGALGLEKRDRVYWAGRISLLRRPEDVPTYDRVFASYWQSHIASASYPVDVESVTFVTDDADDEDETIGDDSPEEDVQMTRYSAIEVLRDRDLAKLSAEEWAEAQRLLALLRVSGEMRASRRQRLSHRRAGSRPDLRATIRQALRTDGQLIHLEWRARTERPRRVVLVLDVSGSMEPYARGLIRFAHAAVGSRRSRQVEVFALGTRLTRITRELARRDPDAALSDAVAVVNDWSGGTRLGTGLMAFNDLWGVRGLARGAVVVILSDGWDRGAPELLGAEMARLWRVAHRVVWVNPLKASPGFAPLAQGMAAALPFVDEFVEGHSIASLERLAAIIQGGDASRRR